jgi:hypothetical protein
MIIDCQVWINIHVYILRNGNIFFILECVLKNLNINNLTKTITNVLLIFGSHLKSWIWLWSLCVLEWMAWLFYRAIRQVWWCNWRRSMFHSCLACIMWFIEQIWSCGLFFNCILFLRLNPCCNWFAHIMYKVQSGLWKIKICQVHGTQA